MRALRPADMAEIRALTGGFGLTPERLGQELAARDDFRWMGLTDPDGRLSAVHRAMRWGPLLLLKGVFVREDTRGSGAAIRLALALRAAAEAEGLPGIAVWYEPGMPESAIAELLRVRPRGPLVHRITLPLPTEERAAGTAPVDTAPTASADTAPTGTAPTGTAPAATATASEARPPAFRGEFTLPPEAVEGPAAEGRVDLLDGLVPDARPRWVLDGDRLVSSVGLGPDGVAALVDALGPVARRVGARTLEFPVLAADVLGALRLARTGARRRNRVPVRLGTLSLNGSPPDTPPATVPARATPEPRHVR
ncbi:hypothetical protein GCM10022227_12450 [Streptomyces sedi]